MRLFGISAWWLAALLSAQEPLLPVTLPQGIEASDFADDEEADLVEDPAIAPPVTPVAEPPTVSAAEPQPLATPEQAAEDAAPPAIVLRDMPEAELAELSLIKPEPMPDAPLPPPGMSPMPGLLLPTYSNLARRTPQGDWVSCHFKQPTVPREQTRVAVLGYHDFSNTKSVTEMRMRTAEFCRQMQFLKDSDICVISMQDFMEWRAGTRCLPAKCVLITIDDGWKSVYTDAYPVLKAYGYPFTMYVYVRYIEVQGASLTKAQIQEMQAHGATIGSHSWNHLYPSKWKRYQMDSEEYAQQLRKELPDSRTQLMEWFGPCSTYCYPGGYHTEPMRKTLYASGYRAAFTVIEGKVGCDVDFYRINRYMVFGVDTSIFRRAVNFGGQDGVEPTIVAVNAAEAPARLFFPAAFSGVESPLVQTEKTAAEKKAAAESAAAPQPEQQSAPADAPVPPAELTPPPASAPSQSQAPPPAQSASAAE